MGNWARIDGRTLVVFEEKHGSRYFVANDTADFERICLKVVRERLEEGYWYGDRKSIEEERPKPPECTEEQAKTLPENLRKIALNDIRAYKSALAETNGELKLLEKAETAAKNNDGKLASEVIVRRQDYEYEGFRLEQIEGNE